jgi:Spy/CpxP family protein refolding chaperone
MMGGPGGPMGAANLDAIKSYLNLTDSQISSLQALQTQTRTANQQTMTDLRTKEQALQTLLQGSSPDPTAVGKALLDIQSTRATLKTAHTNLVSQAVALLTPDQVTKLKALSDAQALEPQIHEASMLNLLAPPANADGAFGPMGFGRGMGPMGRMGRR